MIRGKSKAMIARLIALANNHFVCHRRKRLLKNPQSQYQIVEKYNLQINELEWSTIRNFMEQKSLALLKHEGKVYARTGFDPSRYFQVNKGDRTFFIVSTRVFHFILEATLMEACLKYPNNFGIYRTDTVLDALYNVEPVNSRRDFADFLQTEQFAWIIEFTNNKPNPQILRVDLFRLIKPSIGVKSDFVGGLFHAFKHFSYRGIPLSTHPDQNDLTHPKNILTYLIDGFFFQPHTVVGSSKFSSIVTINEKYEMIFHFYFEPVTQVYFIASIRKQKR